MFIIFDSVEQVNVKFVGEINVMFHIEHLNFGPQTFKANFSGRRGRGPSAGTTTCPYLHESWSRLIYSNGWESSTSLTYDLIITNNF